MGMRKYQRAVAKARLKCMGVKSNRLGSGIMPHGNALRKKMKYAHGRKYLAYLRKQKEAVWRRVMFGDLEKEGLKAQILEGQRIKRRQMTKQMMKKRKLRQISAPAQ